MNEEVNKSALSVAIHEGRKVFEPNFRAQQEEPICLGIAIARYFKWDTVKLLQTAYAAFEDANMHQECAQLEEMLIKLNAEAL